MANVAKLPDRDTPAGEVAAEVRVHLARRGWSGRRLASALGKTQPYISRRLSGDVPFDSDDLSRIGKALGVHPGAFFPQNDEGPRDGGLRLSEAEQRVIIALRSSLLEMDSNHQPAGLQPAPEFSGRLTQFELHRRAKEAAHRAIATGRNGQVPA